MAEPGRFGTVITAMVTPFDDKGALDVTGAAVLARWLADHGSEAIVLTATTGEGPTLSDEEKIELWRAVRQAVTIPVIVAPGSNDTLHSVRMTREAERAAADAILVVGPYYNRPSQSGIRNHFRAVAEATTLPVLLYDIPIRTGRKIATESILILARETTNIVGLKDAAGDVAATAHLLSIAPPSFEVYSGDDSLTLPLLAVGAVGVVGVATHWAGMVFAQMIEQFRIGDVDGARRANANLIESYQFESDEIAPNPVPVKAMVRVLGLPAGQCRLPLGESPPGLEDRARVVLDRLHAAQGV